MYAYGQGEQDLVSEGPDNFSWSHVDVVESCYVYKDGGSEDSSQQVDTDKNGDSSEDDRLLHTRQDIHIVTDTTYAHRNIYTHTFKHTFDNSDNSHTKNTCMQHVHVHAPTHRDSLTDLTH